MKNTPIFARSVLVLHGYRLYRDIIVVLLASIAIWVFGISIHRIGNWKLEINWT